LARERVAIVRARDHTGIEAVKAGSGREGLDALTKYIPTETITLFIACASAKDALASAFPGAPLGLIHVYWLFAALTPALVWLLTLIEYRRNPGPEPFKPPLWRMAAATIAFLVWALAVPGMVEGEAKQVLVAVGALLVSSVLELIGRLFEPRPPVQP
jgi:hypothetical protein